MRVWDSQKMADFVAEEARLETEFSAVKDKLQQAYEGDGWSDSKTAQYMSDQARHGQLARELKIVQEKIKNLDEFNPERIKKSNQKIENSAFRRFLAGGPDQLESDERDMFLVENSAQGLGFNFGPQAQTASDATSGQELVQETVVPRVINRLNYYGGVARFAQHFNTGTGNDYRIPQHDESTVMGELLAAQATAVTALDMANFGVVNFGAYTASSKPITITREMIQDSIIDITGYANRVVARRLGRLWDSIFTINDKAANPNITGVLNLAKAGVTAASATAVTFDEVVDLIYKIDRAYREPEGEIGEGGLMDSETSGTTGFIIADSMEQLLCKLKDSDGRPIWRPLSDSSLMGSMGGSIQGFPYVVSGKLPAVATGKVPMLFGNFSYYGIRNINNLEIFRFQDSRTMQKNTIEILGFNRRDAKGMATLQNSALEMIVKLTMG